MVTNLWPSARRPGWGVFVRNRAESLRRLGVDVTVIAPADLPSAALRYLTLLFRVGKALFTPRRPHVVVEAHIAYPTGLLAWILRIRLRAPIVLFAHGSDVLVLPDRSRLDRLMSVAIFRWADLIVANSRFVADEVIARFGVARRRVTVCPPGILFDVFHADVDADSDSSSRSGWLFVGNLVPVKGLAVLLDAIAELERRGMRPPCLTVVGGGPEEAALRRVADQLATPVRFAGVLGPSDVAEKARQADVLIVPSRAEALGLAALEGLAAGCLVVASDVGGLAETLRDGLTALMCSAGDPNALANALIRAAALDPKARNSMKAAGFELARSHDVQVVTARSVDLYAVELGGKAFTQ